ncbi:MAG TPA: MauE/DoxX family redox-associated membrane protein [Actinocrinis sp.]|nr:MauE/DoxX family redox-associated membrane protein [Actinocrinis sp.]
MTAERGTAATNGKGKGGAGGAGGGKGTTSKQAVLEPEIAPKSAFATATPWISLVARLLLGAMWLFYCLPKLGAADANAASVRNFKILPGAMVNTFAYAQPYVELALGLLAIVGLGTRLVAALSALLLLVYIGGIASLGIRGIHITCGCGGSGGQVAAGQTRYTLDILRDVLYLVPAVWLVWKPKSKFSADAALLPELTPVAPVPTPRRSAPAKGGPSRR